MHEQIPSAESGADKKIHEIVQKVRREFFTLAEGQTMAVWKDRTNTYERVKIKNPHSIDGYHFIHEYDSNGKELKNGTLAPNDLIIRSKEGKALMREILGKQNLSEEEQLKVEDQLFKN